MASFDKKAQPRKIRRQPLTSAVASFPLSHEDQAARPAAVEAEVPLDPPDSVVECGLPGRAGCPRASETDEPEDPQDPQDPGADDPEEEPCHCGKRCGGCQDEPQMPDLQFDEESGQRIIRITGPVDWDTVDYVGRRLARLIASSEEPITVFITSPGGSLDCGLAIYDLLTTNPCPIITAVFGGAHSVATLIAQAGLHRLISPNSTMIIHNVHCFIADDLDHLKLKKLGKHMEAAQRRYERIVCDRAGISPVRIRKWCEEERCFTAKQAVFHKLVDEII